MINKEFLSLIESSSYSIGDIMHELLQIPTYKAFFAQKIIGIQYTDFRAVGEIAHSSKVDEFVSLNKNNSTVVGPIQFIDFLINHPSDNVLKLVIEDKITLDNNYASSLDMFKDRFKEFKENFLNEHLIPYTTNLTLTTLTNKSYTSVLGRDKELRELKLQLGKLMKNNVVLTGLGGVGKTAIVEEFALQEIDKYTVYELNVLGLISKGKEAASILDSILETLSNLPGENVLFIDEFHILVKEGLADAIKRLTSRASNIKFIVATTTDEFRMFVEKDKALERRFCPIPIRELEGDALTTVLEEWANLLKKSFDIDFNDNIIPFVIEKMKVERSKTSPDKEKDILDAAFSSCKLDNKCIVDKEIVADVMSSRLCIPKDRLLCNMFDVIANLEENLKKEIKGQDNAIKNVVQVLESSQMRKKKNKPLAVLFLVGPTSVGKTELARQLAMQLFGSEKNLVQIDCTNFKESHTVSSLLGSPPGYVSSESGGKLINEIKQKPFSVILFDEFEKAHKDIHDIMLPMFEEGIITDRLGRVADVTNCLIILTSNLGAKTDATGKSIDTHSAKRFLGFDKEAISYDDYDNNQAAATDRYKSYLKTLNKEIRPELISRINEIVIFSKLTPEVISDITVKQLNSMIEFYKKEYSMEMSYSNEVIDYIVKKSTSNPRKINMSIEKYIESKITQAYAKKQISDGSIIEIDVAEPQESKKIIIIKEITYEEVEG